jgi:TonB family protein
MPRVTLLSCIFLVHLIFDFNTVLAQDKIMVHADEMPYFTGCSEFNNQPEEKRQCSNYNLVSFISSHLKYPEEAKKEGLEGTVIVSFVISDSGQVKDPYVLKDIGGGCGEEALSILQNMPLWESGKHEGQKVNVKLNLPIKFTLSGAGASTKYRILWGNIKGKYITKKEIKASLLESITVKGPYGEDIPTTEVIIAYERKNKFLDAVGQSKMNDEQKRLLKKARKKGIITFSATIQVGGEFIEVDREFEVVKTK